MGTGYLYDIWSPSPTSGYYNIKQLNTGIDNSYAQGNASYVVGIDRDNNIFFNSGAGYLRKLANDGSRTASTITLTGATVVMADIVFDSNNNLYCCNTTNGIYKVPSGGTTGTKIETGGIGSLCIGTSGVLYGVSGIALRKYVDDSYSSSFTLSSNYKAGGIIAYDPGDEGVWVKSPTGYLCKIVNGVRTVNDFQVTYATSNGMCVGLDSTLWVPRVGTTAATRGLKPISSTGTQGTSIGTGYAYDNVAIDKDGSLYAVPHDFTTHLTYIHRYVGGIYDSNYSVNNSNTGAGRRRDIIGMSYAVQNGWLQASNSYSYILGGI